MLRCHHHLAAKAHYSSFNTMVICSNQDPIQIPRLADAFINMLDHRFAADSSQWLSRKAGRAIARRDDSHNAHRVLNSEVRRR